MYFYKKQNFMSTKIIKIAFAALLLISPSFVKAAGMGMGSPPCGGPFAPCPVPLDNNIYLLLIVGAAYGGKKIYDSTRKNPA